jgi:hypothetical protein
MAAIDQMLLGLRANQRRCLLVPAYREDLLTPRFHAFQALGPASKAS